MKIVFLSFFLLAAGFDYIESQLLTPTMVCEMQCLQNAGAPQSLTYDHPIAQKCREYCRVHAYDNLLGITTPPQDAGQ